MFQSVSSKENKSPLKLEYKKYQQKLNIDILYMEQKDQIIHYPFNLFPTSIRPQLTEAKKVSFFYK